MSTCSFSNTSACREAPHSKEGSSAPLRRMQTWEEIVTKRQRPVTPAASRPPSPAQTAIADTAVPMEEDGLAPEEGELPDA